MGLTELTFIEVASMTIRNTGSRPFLVNLPPDQKEKDTVKSAESKTYITPGVYKLYDDLKMLMVSIKFDPPESIVTPMASYYGIAKVLISFDNKS
jgi:hypothetical protein